MKQIPHKFTPADYEYRWQQYWEEKKVYKTPEITNRPSENGNETRFGEKRQTATSEKPKDTAVVHETGIVAERRLPRSKRYILDMFPYPSAQGLHVGHPEGYTATDIYSRYLRMKGYAVLHPMGWDAFGLPAENFAIKQGIHPKITTEKAIENFRRQIKSLGFSYDWEKELATCKPDYYKWTQWLFEFLYRQGLAYKKKAPVNWCESCKTVLANEQVVDGKCERCHHAVIQKEIAQWFFKITDFADELLSGLDKIDWPISTKTGQRNWIGRSEGLLIKFPILQDKLAVSSQQSAEDKKNTANCKLQTANFLEVFTTRPDTIYGVTFLVLAPEHDAVLKLTDSVHMPQMLKYLEQTTHKTRRQRTDLNEKSGVFTGAYTLNPVSQEKIPIYVSDYVVMDYGTGAIMGVPAHDKRDFDFANKVNLNIKAVCISEETYNKLTRGNKNEISSGNNAKIREIINAKSGNKFPQETKNAASSNTYSIAQLESFGLKFPHEIYGICINSGEYSGLTSKQCITKLSDYIISQGIGKKSIKYKLRDWLISRQRYWGAPIPIIYCETCGENLVPASELPVLLPEDVDFRPTGESPLQRSVQFHKVKCPKCGGPARRESDTMDTFVCSSWYYFAFTFWEQINKQKSQFSVFSSQFSDKSSSVVSLSVLETDKLKTDKLRSDNRKPRTENRDNISIYQRFQKEIAAWLPVDLYVGGAEHTVLHLLYSRFITKALHRAGLIQFDEPFLKLRHIGMILGKDGQKMSKSRGNVINPDEIVNKFGADTMRLYEMFMGPLSDKKAWNTHGVEGCHRFLSRVWHLVVEIDKKILDCENEKIWQATQKLVFDVENDIQEMKFNTAIAKMMSWLNEVSSLVIPAKAGIQNHVETRHGASNDKNHTSPHGVRDDNQSVSTISRRNVARLPASGGQVPTKTCGGDNKKTIKEALTTFLKVLAPFAPHLAEELNYKLARKLSDASLNNYRSIHLESWPVVGKDTIISASDNVFLVEVNGRVVEKIQFSVLSSQLSDMSWSVVGQSVQKETEKPKTDELNSENRKQRTDNRVSFVETPASGGSNEENHHAVGIANSDLKIAIEQYCLSLPRVKSRLAGKLLKKTIYIPNKLINFVV